MVCPHDQPPFGYCIQYSNNAECPRWLVMEWCWILQVCATLPEAYDYLMKRLGEEDEESTDRSG